MGRVWPDMVIVLASALDDARASARLANTSSFSHSSRNLPLKL
jgi:hypothetical protein